MKAHRTFSSPRYFVFLKPATVFVVSFLRMAFICRAVASRVLKKSASAGFEDGVVAVVE